MTNDHFKYWAFISYSHRDAKWAQWLHRQLETYRIPRALVNRTVNHRNIPRRLLPIFRDRDELPSTSSLSEAIREALSAASALIVICSPSSAQSQWVNEEIRVFKSLNRRKRIFPLIVDGSPNVGASSQGGPQECFPPQLQSAPADNDEEGRQVDPLAADARTSGDGRGNAVLKLVAGILEVGFDDLKRRDRGRRRRRIRLGAALCFSGLAAVLCGYLIAADVGVNLPIAEYLRQKIDAHRVSVFRPIHTGDEIDKSFADFCNEIRPIVRSALEPSGNARLSEWPGATGGWEGSEILAALLSDRGIRGPEVLEFANLFDRLFAKEFLVMREGRITGWWDSQGAEYARAEPTLYVLIALSAALSPEEELEARRRSHLADLLKIAQAAAETYFDSTTGSWHAVAGEVKPGNSTYASALALHALLETLGTGAGWRDDHGKLLAMIDATTRWFEQTFVAGPIASGWGSTADAQEGPNADLSIMIYGLLARSHSALGTRMGAHIETAGMRELIALQQRRFDSPGPNLRIDGSYKDADGNLRKFWLSSYHLWYPWALLALNSWLSYMDNKGFAPFLRTRLERSFSYLAYSIIADVRRDLLADRTLMYRLAETYYGVAMVRKTPVPWY